MSLIEIDQAVSKSLLGNVYVGLGCLGSLKIDQAISNPYLSSLCVGLAYMELIKLQPTSEPLLMVSCVSLCYFRGCAIEPFFQPFLEAYYGPCSGFPVSAFGTIHFPSVQNTFILEKSRTYPSCWNRAVCCNFALIRAVRNSLARLSLSEQCFWNNLLLTHVLRTFSRDANWSASSSYGCDPTVE